MILVAAKSTARQVLVMKATDSGSRAKGQGGSMMLYYALVFLIVGLIAGALGLVGVAAVAGQIA